MAEAWGCPGPDSPSARACWSQIWPKLASPCFTRRRRHVLALLYSRAGEPAKSLRAPFDSHYVCIGRDGYQCVDGLRGGRTPDYDELVLNEGSQLLPAYRLFFRVNVAQGCFMS